LEKYRKMNSTLNKPEPKLKSVIKKLVKLFKVVLEIHSLPRVKIRLFGNEKCRKFYSAFTKPHPKYKIIPTKTIGVALLRIPDTFEDYLKGKERQALRTNRTKALKEGFKYSQFEANQYVEDILAINTSVPVRQAKPMDKSYTTREMVLKFIEDNPVLHGVFNKEGTLVAYSQTVLCGEALILNRIIGHAAFLDQGIMYLLVIEIVKEMISLKKENGLPLWIMYDMFFGALPGLRYFKERLGFKPYRVIWLAK